MSEHSTGVAEAPKPTFGSLEERIAERREKLERATSETFDVPGFEGIFQVELRIVGGKRQLAIVNEHERVRDEYQRLLRSATDLILAATIGFHQYIDEEGNTVPVEDATWKRIACGVKKLNLPESTESRVALIRLLGEQGVLDLAGDWRLWMRNRGQKVDAKLGDFS